MKLLSRIQSYLGNGGLDGMDNVPDLLNDCRTEIGILTARLDECHKMQKLLIRNIANPKPPNDPTANVTVPIP